MTIAGAGNCDVTASQAGNDSFNPAPNVTRGFTIAPKAVTGGFTAQNKTYDGNNGATIATRELSGKVGADGVSLSGGTASFADKNAANGKTVTVTRVDLSGRDARNYSLASAPWTTTADITQKALTGTFTANNKVYDGTRAATVASKSLPGVINPDAVALDVTGAQFDTKNFGDGKDVSADLALSGANAGNYRLNSATASTTANITPAALTVKADNQVITYGDALPNHTASFAGFVNGEGRGDLNGQLQFGTNPANPKDVGNYAITPGGLSSNNYDINFADGNLRIAKANLTVTAIDASRQYGTADPQFSVRYSAFKNNEGASVLGGTLSFTTNATATSLVGGNYYIRPAGLTSANYASTSPTASSPSPTGPSPASSGRSTPARC